jgi:hypothetical protein
MVTAAGLGIAVICLMGDVAISGTYVRDPVLALRCGGGGGPMPWPRNWLIEGLQDVYDVALDIYYILAELFGRVGAIGIIAGSACLAALGFNLL